MPRPVRRLVRLPVSPKTTYLTPPRIESLAHLSGPKRRILCRRYSKQRSTHPGWPYCSWPDEIEKKAHGVAASIGKGGEDGPLPFPEAIARLDRYYRLPRHVTSSLTLFLDVRKKLVHGGFAKDEDMVSALDSGVTIFRALKSLPRKRIWVIHRKDVPVYSDQECRHEIKKIRGVILKTTGPSTESATYRIFPSTKTEFVEGQRVLGEWDLSRTWPCAWYVDPDSDQVELAWESAGEFVGSHLE